jgi:16S rRNA (guanine966-N2)-methyltransferase
VREALFSSLEAAAGSLEGLRFLDLYAGSGAVGLEAWSRGAGVVTLVEQDRRTASLVRANASAVGYPGADVVTGDVAAVLRRAPSAPYDLVFLDPPYPVPDADVSAVLRQLVAGDWLVPGAVVVLERSSRGPGPDWPDGLVGDREKRYGETVLHFAHAR